MQTQYLLDLAHSAGLWLATYWVHSTLLFIVAWGLSRRLRSPAQRELVWRTALIGGIVTAALQPVLGGVRLERMRFEWPAPVVLPSAPGSQRIGLVGVVPDGSPSGLEAPPAVGESPSVLASLRWPGALAAVWLLGAGFALVRLSSSRRRLLTRMPRRLLTSREVTLPMAELMRAEPVMALPRVSESPCLSSPIALSRSEICIPEGSWRRLSRGQLRSLLAHELAHVRRRDPTWLFAVHAIERAFFLQPLNRLMKRELMKEAEYLCDDWAARRAGSATELAGCLAEVASWGRERTLHGLAPGMAREPSSLVLRVRRLLSGESAREPGRTHWALWAGGVCILGLLACAGPGIEVEEQDPELVIAARIVASEEPFATVDIDSSGDASVQQGEVSLGSADLNSREGRDELTRILAELARSMPTGPVDESGRNVLPSGRVRIRLSPGTSYRYVQRVMECCGKQPVQIWNLEVSSTEAGSQAYSVPLPFDVGLDADPAQALEETVELIEEEREDGGMSGSRLTLVITPSGSGSDRVVHCELRSKGSSRGSELSGLGDLLRSLQLPGEGTRRITIDARSGTLYQDVRGALDAIRDAGFHSVVFVGSRE